MVVKDRLSFRGTPVMYAMILLELPTLLLVGTFYFKGKLGDEGWIALLIVGTLLPLTFLLLMNISLDIRMDDSSFSYRSSPFQPKWKKLAIEEIRSISIHKKDGFLDYGGIGLRISGKTRAYIFLADHLIELEAGNRKLVFSTQKPEEFKEMIKNWNLDNL
jgi:hypothetical protein